MFRNFYSKNKLEEMIPIDPSILKEIGSEPIPNHLNKWWFALGGTVLYLFIIQVFTGIMLTIYYVPSPAEAYESIKIISHEIRFGWYIRSLHKWASHLMIVALFMHMARVYFTGSYRHPRQLNWMVGFGLLGTTLTFGFTGYSLIYEQLSFWGSTVATNLVEALPLVGKYLAYLMRGGSEISGNTLTRFFMLHVAILPVITFVLICLHVIFIRIHGVKEVFFEGAEEEKKDRFFKFWPDHVTTELMVGLFLMYVLTLLSIIFPAELGEPANPNITPLHIKPEWYFYFSYRLLKLTSLKMSVLISGVIVIIIFFWPFIEEILEKKFSLSKNASTLIGTLTFSAFLTLTVWEALA